MNIDFGLVMYDFVAVFREGEGNENEIAKGVQTFTQLVLDKMACRARMTFLHALDAREESPESIPLDDHLSECIKHIVQLGIDGALAEGNVKPRDLADLGSHPTALWKLHCALCGPDHGPAVKDSSGDRCPHEC